MADKKDEPTGVAAENKAKAEAEAKRKADEQRSGVHKGEVPPTRGKRSGRE